ncbi:MAG: dephospho-CoA kinase [Candidatus Omnitrophota bacterium]
MSVFAITGSLCSGKSTVLKMFKDKGACIFDTDKKIHQYYKDRESSVYKKVIVAFPQALKKGKISRSCLGAIVFSNKKELKKLERIVHPAVTEDLLNWLDKAKNKKIVYPVRSPLRGTCPRQIVSNGVYAAEVPLLFEKKLGQYFDRTILITAKKRVVLKRIAEKYNFSSAQALDRLALYIPVKEKVKKANFIIDNSLGIEELKKEVNLLWKKIK